MDSEIRSYFEDANSQYDIQYTSPASKAAYGAVARITDKLFDSTLDILPKKALDITQPPQQNLDIEESIRKQKHQEAAKRKQELLDKLSQVEYNIESLESKKKLQRIADLKALRKQWQNEEDEHAEDREKFIKKMATLRKERQIKRKEMLKKMKQTAMDQENREKQERQVLLDDRLKQRQEQLALARARSQQRIVDRKDFHARSQMAFKQAKSKTQTFHKIEDNYAQTRVLPELKRRKKELAKKHDYFKLDLAEIDEHAKAYEDQQKQQAEQRIAAQDKWRSEVRQNQAQQANHYKSKTIEIERQAPPQPPGYYEKTEEQKRVDMRMRYATLAREIYKPKIDSNKRLQIANIKLQASTPKPKMLTKSSSLAPGAIRYRKKPKQSTTTLTTPRLTTVKKSGASDRTASSTKTDYLAEMRVKRENMRELGSMPRKISNTYDKIMADANLSELDRLNQIKNQSKKIDSIAKQNNIIYSGKNDDQSLAASGQVAEMFIDTIKAKLALLAQINS